MIRCAQMRIWTTPILSICIAAILLLLSLSGVAAVRKRRPARRTSSTSSSSTATSSTAPARPGIRATSAFAHGRIAAIGNLHDAPRKQTIDAHGQVVAPGFIDMLGQSEMTMLVNPRVPSKIFQGITTEVTGEGGSAAPLNAAMIEADRAGYDHLHIHPDWTTFHEYFARLERQGMGINLASYVGATSVRRMVLGDADVQPTADQLEQMQALVD